MIFVREGTEGEYAGVGARLYRGSDREVALQTAVFSRHGMERVIRWAFELAARKAARSRASARATRSTTRPSSGIRSSTRWRRSTRPCRPSACWSTPRRCSWSWTPSGSAWSWPRTCSPTSSPTSARRSWGGWALRPAPTSTRNAPSRRCSSPSTARRRTSPVRARRTRSARCGAPSMMLDHLGHPEWADALMKAIERVIAERRVRTPDLGGDSRTEEMGEAVLAALDAAGRAPAAATAEVGLPGSRLSGRRPAGRAHRHGLVSGLRRRGWIAGIVRYERCKHVVHDGCCCEGVSAPLHGRSRSWSGVVSGQGRGCSSCDGKAWAREGTVSPSHV